jgi:hypothetical protein
MTAKKSDWLAHKKKVKMENKTPADWRAHKIKAKANRIRNTTTLVLATGERVKY